MHRLLQIMFKIKFLILSKKFGLPKNFRATNVVLPNGSLDPWSTLRCNVTVEEQHQFVRTTVGGTHCIDMYPYDPSKYPQDAVEPADVNATIQLVKREVAYYISLPSPFGGEKNTTAPTQGAPTSSVMLATLIAGIYSSLMKVD